MPKEKSAGAIIFRKEGERPLYLLLHYPSTKRAKKEYWDFPKGHVEGKETDVETVRREVQEETGIKDLEFFPGFKETITYFFQVKGKRIFKTVVFFLASTRTTDVTISTEHEGFIWLPFEQAFAQLKFANAKRLLTKSHHLISKQGVQGSQSNQKGPGQNVQGDS
ncbi:MAG: NUDIX domain-containing protein [Candidatus Wildermuthbacteria bacterium]|nr:NUDIX domain-containing protein [Candidatus Wildermuthbacteria bacterium]